jgi:hypothetical protein
VVELREELCLTLESREALLVLGEIRRQDLDRDVALELGVVGAIDLAHPAFAELGGDLVGAQPRSDHRAAIIALPARDPTTRLRLESGETLASSE